MELLRRIRVAVSNFTSSPHQCSEAEELVTQIPYFKNNFRFDHTRNIKYIKNAAGLFEICPEWWSCESVLEENLHMRRNEPGHITRQERFNRWKQLGVLKEVDQILWIHCPEYTELDGTAMSLTGPCM